MKRDTLDADLAEVMKKLAKDKMLRAKSDVAYAKGDYEKEMEQAALKKEAEKKIWIYLPVLQRTSETDLNLENSNNIISPYSPLGWMLTSVAWTQRALVIE